jgi:hypothetical protein
MWIKSSKRVLSRLEVLSELVPEYYLGLGHLSRKMPYCDYCVKLPIDRSCPDLRGFSWSGCNALDAYVHCFQSLSKFPSWTSRVRVPSPAPFSFNQLQRSASPGSKYSRRIVPLNGVADVQSPDFMAFPMSDVQPNKACAASPCRAGSSNRRVPERERGPPARPGW